MTNTKLAAEMLRCFAELDRGYDRAEIEAQALALEQQAVVDVSDAMVERAAEAHWNASPGGHMMLKKAGYATDWASQPRAVKRDTYKQVRAALAAAHVPSGMVLVPEAKLRDWAWRLERDLRRGHQCDVARNAESVMQSIAAVIAAAQGESNE